MVVDKILERRGAVKWLDDAHLLAVRWSKVDRNGAEREAFVAHGSWD